MKSTYYLRWRDTSCKLVRTISNPICQAKIIATKLSICFHVDVLEYANDWVVTFYNNVKKNYITMATSPRKTARCPVHLLFFFFFPRLLYISIYTSLSVQQGSPVYLIACACSPPQKNDTSLIKSAWMRSGCHGNNYQSCLINFLNCLMIYDPMNSLISSLSLIRTCFFFFSPS